MSEQPGQVRPDPPAHDPIIHLDFRIPCMLPPSGTGTCPNNAVYIGYVHSCADKRNGRMVAFCQDYLDAVLALDDYPYKCNCGHDFTSLINYVWDWIKL